MRAVVVLGLMLLGCTGKDIRRPGESLGFYSVTGELRANSCGDAPSPWQFRVELRKETIPTPRLHWTQGDLPISSALAADGTAAFSSESLSVLSPPTQKSAGCTLVRKDTVNLKLAEDASSFTGSLTYVFMPDPGSSCTNVSAAGITQAPCSIEYGLTAESEDTTK